MISRETLVARLSEEGGLTLTEAERALEAVLATVTEELPEAERAALEADVPDARRPKADVPGTFYERMRWREGTTLGFAREHAQVALRVLGDVVSPPLRDRMVELLPVGVAEHVGPRPVEGLPPSHEHHDAEAQPSTLALGRPGSKHPLSSAAPPGAHSQSVARSANPHADTKLSSARGLTQERHAESLASGKPR